VVPIQLDARVGLQVLESPLKRESREMAFSTPPESFARDWSAAAS
jgi:hypothetical protein